MGVLGQQGSSQSLVSHPRIQHNVRCSWLQLVGDFAKLQELYVGSSSVTDNSLDGLKKTTTLVKVSLGGNPLVTETGLKSLRRSLDLGFLDLNGIRLIPDFTLKGFVKLQQLKELRINDRA